MIYFSCHRQITSKHYVTPNHTYSTFTQVSPYLVTKSWLISMSGMIDVATMYSTSKADRFGCTLFKFEDNAFRVTKSEFLLMFVCLPLSRHFPCCKTWWIKNLNLNLIMTKHMVNFTKLGLRFHQNSSLIKNAYCNCETPNLVSTFQTEFGDFVLKIEKKKIMKEKKKNNNRCIILIQ